MEEFEPVVAGVSRIFMVDAFNIPRDLRELHEAGGKAVVIADIKEIPLCSAATLQHNRKGTRTGIEESVRLEFEISRPLGESGIGNPAFVVLTSAGEKYLIGSYESPRAMVEEENDHSTGKESKRKISVKVTWAGPLVRCRLPRASF